MGYEKKKIYITYKHQEWTYGTNEDLIDKLDGDDDEILEFYVSDDNFAIITRNGYTYDVKNSRQEAQNYIDRIYSAYEMYDKENEYCYVPVNNPKIGYLTEADARQDGYNDVVYVPQGYHYLVKNGRVIANSQNIEDLYRIMNSDYGADFSFIC